MTVTGGAGTQSALGATVNTITTGSGADTVTGGDFAGTLTTNMVMTLSQVVVVTIPLQLPAVTILL